jgi:hypothetical protein
LAIYSRSPVTTATVATALLPTNVDDMLVIWCYRRVMLIVLGVNFFTQATGIEAAVYYTPQTLKSAGMLYLLSQC